MRSGVANLTHLICDWQVKKLMGYDPLTKYLVLAVQLIHITTAYLMRNTPFWSLHFFFVAWLVGGSCSQNTFLAVHEITHNLAFKGVKENRLFAIFTNCSIGVPFAMMFKKYHIDHHKVSRLAQAHAGWWPGSGGFAPGRGLTWRFLVL